MSERSRAALSAGCRVRPVCTHDAERLGTVHAQGWHEAYTGLISPESLATARPELRAQRWRTILGNPDRVDCTLAGLDRSGLLVGFGSAGPARDTGCPAALELWSLYVLACAYGTGLADLLIEQLLADHPAYLWVLEGNERAAAFYRRHGFLTDGVAKHDPVAHATDLRMVRH